MKQFIEFMLKSDMIILAVPKDILFGADYFEGFSPANKIDFGGRIIKNLQWMRRGDAEENINFKHAIAYCIIVNPRLKKVFAYQRSMIDEQYPERRLQGNWSWGIGGHLEQFDSSNTDLLNEGMRREVAEEVDIEGAYEPRPLGYINNDYDEVGKYHFGLLYLIITDADQVKPKDPEIAQGGFKTVEELEEIIKTPGIKVDEWSKIALGPIKEYFLTL